MRTDQTSGSAPLAAAESRSGETGVRGQVERRPRIPVQFPMTLSVAVDGPRAPAAMLNLSAGGVFAQCATRFPVGTALWVSLALPSGGAWARVTTAAWVRWVNDPASPAAPALPGGMGMEFLGLDDETRKTLEAFIEDRVAAGATVH